MARLTLVVAPFVRSAIMSRFFGLAITVLLVTHPITIRAQADDRVIYTSVVNKDGEPVLDLSIKDFTVREDGQPREILSVARDTDPLQIALLVDNSAVMRNQLSDLRRALGAFVDATRDGVQIALI